MLFIGVVEYILVECEIIVIKKRLKRVSENLKWRLENCFEGKKIWLIYVYFFKVLYLIVVGDGVSLLG